MFGGSGARLPGHEDYRVDTHGSVGTTIDSESEFDLFFNADSYMVDDMEPSCGTPPAPDSGSRHKSARKKWMARKDKATAVPLPAEQVNNEYES